MMMMMMMMMMMIDDTVEAPVSHHPKCQDLVVAYGRWSLTRVEPEGSLLGTGLTYTHLLIRREFIAYIFLVTVKYEQC